MSIQCLPCLRCATGYVGVSLLGLALGRRNGRYRDGLTCRHCDGTHYLQITPIEHGYEVVYQPYTLRYPLEMYDDEVEVPFVRVNAIKGSVPSDDSGFTGPVTVYPRKSYFKRSEVSEIWRATKGKCHLCSTSWKLSERGRNGWHIDHVIPHIGGGSDTEEMPNFRVACAKCNLSKGKGQRPKLIRASIHSLVEKLSAGIRHG